MALSRRKMLRGAAASALCAAMLPRPLMAAAPKPIAFYHLHTGAALHLDFAPADSTARSQALEALDYFLRDFRTEEVHAIDPQLLAQLQLLYAAADYRGRFEVISGYRSPQTNAALRQSGGGVAKNSWHMQGRAIDVRLTTLPTLDLYRAAKGLGHGGVGYYAKSNFVHLDTGPVRSW
jgi:uncharacterized protein YcbK (DUF882 family)